MKILELIKNTQEPSTLTSNLSARCTQLVADTLTLTRASISSTFSQDPNFAIQKYCSLLENKSPFFRNKAAYALFRLAETVEHHTAIVGAGAIPPLVSCLESSDDECRANASDVLNKLLFYCKIEHPTAIINAGAITPLVSCLESSDNDCKANAAIALFRLAEDTQNHHTISCHLSKNLALNHPNIRMPTYLTTDQITTLKETMNTTFKNALDTFTLKIINYFSNTKSLDCTPSNENNQAPDQIPKSFSLTPEINAIIAQQLIQLADTAGVLQNNTSIHKFLKEIGKDITRFYQAIAQPGSSTDNSNNIKNAFKELEKRILNIGTFECLESWQSDISEQVAQAANLN